MDYTIPYTFYPSALPHGLSWGLFALAVIGSLLVASIAARKRKPQRLLLFIPIFLVFLMITIGISMVITFFIHP